MQSHVIKSCTKTIDDYEELSAEEIVPLLQVCLPDTDTIHTHSRAYVLAYLLQILNENVRL